jgi:GNAT superfamily N-acetyltransferase
MPAFSVRELDRRERREAVAVLARAFWHDPLFDVFAKDLLHEQRLLPLFFSAVMNDVVRAGGRAWVAEVDGHPRGVAGWLAPGAYPRGRRHDALFQAQAMAAVARVQHKAMALRLLTELDRRHPKDPHWYLAVLGVDPSQQGKGAGAALLAPVLAQCDAEGLPAYLETQKEANVPWYARFAFAVTGEIRLPSAPPVWCMRREPR